MHSLKLTDEEKNKMSSGPLAIATKEQDYPYGLVVHLDEPTIKKLGIKELPKVGNSLSGSAHFKIIAASVHESEGSGLNRSLELQITHMDLENGEQTSDDEKISKLYGLNEPIGKPLVKG